MDPPSRTVDLSTAYRAPDCSGLYSVMQWFSHIHLESGSPIPAPYVAPGITCCICTQAVRHVLAHERQNDKLCLASDSPEALLALYRKSVAWRWATRYEARELPASVAPEHSGCGRPPSTVQYVIAVHHGGTSRAPRSRHGPIIYYHAWYPYTGERLCLRPACPANLILVRTGTVPGERTPAVRLLGLQGGRNPRRLC